MSRAEVDRLVTDVVRRINALPDHKAQTGRALRKEISNELKGADPRLVLDLADRLVDLDDEGRCLFRFFAYELVRYHDGAFKLLDEKKLERLGRRLDCWEAVDTFCVYLAGRAWGRGQVSDEWIRSLAGSPDRWRRRAALVATVPLNTKSHGGKGDVKRTLELCSLLADDRDDMVVKAVSWALRELVPHDPKGLGAFLKKEEGRLAARVLRETRNKLTTGLKNPRMAPAP